MSNGHSFSHFNQGVFFLKRNISTSLLLLFFCLGVFHLTAISSAAREDDHLSATESAQRGLDPNLNDPPPRKNSGIKYSKVSASQPVVRQFKDAAKGQTESAGSITYNQEINIVPESDRTLLGKVRLTLRNDVPIPQSGLHILVQIENEHSGIFETVAKGSFQNEKTIELFFPGRHTQSVRILAENTQSDASPIQSVELYKIVLSNTTDIMLLGDSITFGKFADDSIGYRKRLYDLLKQNGYDIDFVGDYGDPPYEGHFQSGRKINDFYPRGLFPAGNARLDVTGPMNNYRPQIVAIHLGTNDLNSESEHPVAPYAIDGETQDTHAGRMETLVNYLLKWHNGENGTELEKIIVSLIIPIKYQDSLVAAFDKEVARMVRDFQNGIITGQPEPVVLCDQFTAFEQYPDFRATYYKSLMEDKLHPNTAGHNLMADTYYDTFVEQLTGRQNWFSNITWNADVAGFDADFSSQGIAVADITGDGLDDIYISRTAPDAPFPQEAFYTSQPNLPYIENAQNFHLDDPGQSRGVIFVDIDNDGDFDLFNGNSDGRNHLYENLGNQNFQDITAQAGIADLNRLTTGVLAFDCDNDGDMDLYAVNSRVKNELYINNGLGHFQLEDRGADDHDEADIPSISASAADFDGDGDVDIFIAKRDAPNKLYVNNGAGYFTDMASQAGVDLVARSNGVVWSDLDDDGDLDLLISVSHSDSDPNPILRVYENRGDGTFQDISNSLNIPMDGYSAVVSDFDNDGDPDIITTNEKDYGAFYRNDGSWQFSKLQDTGAEIYAGDVRGAAVFDFDNDGDEDLLAVRSDAFNVFLKNNLANGNHYLQVNAFGPDGNLGGFGTKIWLYRAGQLGEPDGLLGFREIQSATGHTSQYSPTQHFGLGSHLTCDLLAEFTDGTLLAMRDVQTDQKITLEPGSPATERVPAHIEIFSGNAQSDTVGQELPDPLVVKVTAANGQPVQGADVTFNLTEGDAQLFPPSISSNALWVEAETGKMGGSMRWVYDATTSGSAFAMVPAFLQSAGSDTLDVETSADTYFTWLRLAHVNESSSLKIGMDGAPAQQIPLGQWDDWQWVQITDASGAPIVYNLTEAVHSILIESASDNLQIDKILLTPDPQDVPDGLGEEANSNPERSDREGLTRRYVQLGQTAGPVTVDAALENNGVAVDGSPLTFYLTAVPGAPVALEATGGNDQFGHVDEPLSNPFIVTLLDAFGNPIPGQPIQFKVISGGGFLDVTAPVPTDSLGQAKAILTPGSESAIQKVRAFAVNTPDLETIFSVHVDGVASDLVYVQGDSQNADVMSTLPKAVKVKLLTDDGSAAVDYSVVFSVLNEGAMVTEAVFPATSDSKKNRASTEAATSDSSITVHTDSLGMAAVFWQLGRQSGQQQLKIDAGAVNNSPYFIHAQADPSGPAALIVVDGNNQESSIQSKLPKPFTARLLDEYSNPIPGFDVHFISSRGGGTFAGKTGIVALTDSLGDAKAEFTLGTLAGQNVYVVKAFAVSGADTIPNPPLQFYATGLPGPATFAELNSGDGQQDTVAQTLSKSLQVKITDAFENPVAGFNVNFKVASNNGSFNNESEKTVSSNEDGVAEIFFTLGEHAGENQVQAICNSLSPDTISFHATGVADRPQQLVYQSGNDQKGSPNTTLAESLAVKVADQFGNGISDFAVTFTVISDEGRFGSSRSITRSTDSTGVAGAFLTLGESIGDSNHVVLASANNKDIELANSPITFYASVIKGDPQSLVPVTSTTGLLGAAHQELPEPVVVKILDNNEQAVFNFPVHFKVIQGGGNLLPDGTDSLTVLTDSVGCASARWVLGELGQEQTLRASAAWNEQALENSPLTFQAIAIQTDAHRLTYASGNDQSGGVGEALEKDFIVRVYDDLSAPVQDHPVQFSVITGGGYFQENADSLLLVQTDKNGYAHARLVLGNVVGENTNVVHAVSYDSQGIELADSPVIFTATGEPGVFNADQSLITAISPVPANGAAASLIRVMPRDKFGNALPGHAVTIVATGINANVNPLTGVTDADGIFTAQATSAVPGELNIRALDTETSTWFASETIISFFTTDASTAQKAGPSDLTVLPNSALKEPLVIKITNDAAQPVSGFPVTFNALDSNATIDTPQPVYSDSAGLARCRVIAGSEIGAADVLASSPGLQGDSLVFSLSVQEPSNLILVAMNSDTLFGHVSEKLASAVEFALKDGSGRPAGAMKIQINTQDASIAYPDSNLVNTDADGIARTTVTLGRKAGTTQFNAVMNGSEVRADLFITALAGDAAQLVIVSGNHQKQVVGSLLSDSLEIKVTDAFNNGVANRDVLFSILKGNGTFLSPPHGKTDKQGIARALFQLGTQSGKNIVNAGVPDTEINPVEFELIGKPGQARAMSIADGNDQQGIAGHKLNQPLQVLVADQFGNGVPDVQVTFTALPGQGTILPQPKVMSDSLGVAAVEWLLGAQSGQQTIYASHAGLDNSPLSFTATAIANTAPQIQLPDSFVVRENEKLTFQVQAADAQNDTISYFAENLPDGAAFNDTLHTFTWKPTYKQAGYYPVSFGARDQTGAQDMKTITIHVLNVNRPPVISLQDSRPLDHNLGAVEKPRFIRFLVVASDPDSDKLNYLWLENDKRSSVANTFFFRSSETPVGAVTVEALVYDRQDTARAVWTLDVIASVELKYFSGEHQAFKGVKLTWETSSESDNLGFYVSRATKKDGPFVQIGNLIPSQKSGRYQFVDQDITPGEKYYYQLQDVQTDGSRHDHETIMIEPALPTKLTLYQNYPNPFNPSTEIRFELPKPDHVSLVIFDILGRQVRTLIDKEMKPGYYSYKWNGLNADDLQVAAGVYYVLLQTAKKRFVKKMVLLR